MNNKISNLQIGMIFALICSSLYLGLSDVLLIRISGNMVLISMLLGTIIGLIPIYLFFKINNTLPNLNIYEKNNKLFNSKINIAINIFIILIYIVLLIIAVGIITSFVTSKYLKLTPFLFIGALIIITSLLICFKGIEVIARLSELTFILSFILMILIQVLLFRYVEFNNIIPIEISNNFIINIIKGAIYYANTSSLLIVLLLTINKNKVINNKNYEKSIKVFYLISSISLIIVMFFVISVFGFEMSSIFRYPEYILLKKIGLKHSELHIENLLAFRWIFYLLGLCNISTYGILTGVKTYVKDTNKQKIIVTLITIISTLIASFIFNNNPKFLIAFNKYYNTLIALPIFLVLLLIYYKCKKTNSN